MNILIINGPNLKLHGTGEKPTIRYENFESFFENLRETFKDIDFTYYQSNIEGEIVNKLHESGFSADGIILNAGAYALTSVAIRDAIAGIKTPVVEVHTSNTLVREDFNNKSIIGPVCKGCIMGFGLQSYAMAVTTFLD